MGVEATTPCVNCERLQGLVDALTATVAELQTTLDHVLEQLAATRKNSSISSKPPKPLPLGQSKRRIGGQPGRPKHERAVVPPKLRTAPPHDSLPEICPTCDHRLRFAGDDVRVVQQVEIADVPILIEEHRSYPGWCPFCCKGLDAALPIVVQSGCSSTSRTRSAVGCGSLPRHRVET